jgi:hypothetical protein
MTAIEEQTAGLPSRNFMALEENACERSRINALRSVFRCADLAEKSRADVPGDVLDGREKFHQLMSKLHTGAKILKTAYSAPPKQFAWSGGSRVLQSDARNFPYAGVMTDAEIETRVVQLQEQRAGVKTTSRRTPPLFVWHPQNDGPSVPAQVNKGREDDNKLSTPPSTEAAFPAQVYTSGKGRDKESTPPPTEAAFPPQVYTGRKENGKESTPPPTEAAFPPQVYTGRKETAKESTPPPTEAAFPPQVYTGEKGDHLYGISGEEHTAFAHEQRHMNRVTGEDHLGAKIADSSRVHPREDGAAATPPPTEAAFAARVYTGGKGSGGGRVENTPDHADNPLLECTDDLFDGADAFFDSPETNGTSFETDDSRFLPSDEKQADATARSFERRGQDYRQSPETNDSAGSFGTEEKRSPSTTHERSPSTTHERSPNTTHDSSVSRRSDAAENDAEAATAQTATVRPSTFHPNRGHARAPSTEKVAEKVAEKVVQVRSGGEWKQERDGPHVLWTSMAARGTDRGKRAAQHAQHAQQPPRSAAPARRAFESQSATCRRSGRQLKVLVGMSCQRTSTAQRHRFGKDGLQSLDGGRLCMNPSADHLSGGLVVGAEGRIPRGGSGSGGGQGRNGSSGAGGSSAGGGSARAYVSPTYRSSPLLQCFM